METRDVLKRPRWHFTWKLPRYRREAPYFADQGLNLRCQLGGGSLERCFHRRQSRLGPIEPQLRGISRRDRDLGQIRRLLDELPHRRFMQLPECVPLTLNNLFQAGETLLRVAVELRAHVAQFVQAGFEL